MSSPYTALTIAIDGLLIINLHCCAKLGKTMTHLLDKHIVRAKKKNTDFGPSHWKYLFRLFGLVVVADKKIVPESVDAYVKALRELAIVIDPKLVLTQRMVRDWIGLNKPALIKMVDSLEYDTVLLEILHEIKFLPYKLDVITAMVRVAIADGDYSDMKQMFVKKTILYWNIHAAKPLVEPVSPYGQEGGTVHSASKSLVV